jgi:hypothetical protein
MRRCRFFIHGSTNGIDSPIPTRVTPWIVRLPIVYPIRLLSLSRSCRRRSAVVGQPLRQLHLAGHCQVLVAPCCRSLWDSCPSNETRGGLMAHAVWDRLLGAVSGYIQAAAGGSSIRVGLPAIDHGGLDVGAISVQSRAPAVVRSSLFRSINTRCLLSLSAPSFAASSPCSGPFTTRPSINSLLSWAGQASSLSARCNGGHCSGQSDEPVDLWYVFYVFLCCTCANIAVFIYFHSPRCRWDIWVLSEMRFLD